MTESPSVSASAVKRRQYLLLAVIAALILGAALLSVSLTGSRDSGERPARPKSTSILAPGGQVDPKDAWRGQADAQLKSIDQRSRELSQRNTELEGQNKEYATRIIISEATYEYARDEFICRELDLIRVKGKTKPVAIYELLAPATEKSKWQPLLEVFQQGLVEYRAGNFDKALEIFEDILSAYPNDGPSKLFARRSKMFATAPPVGAWDGVFTATTK